MQCGNIFFFLFLSARCSQPTTLINVVQNVRRKISTRSWYFAASAFNAFFTHCSWLHHYYFCLLLRDSRIFGIHKNWYFALILLFDFRSINFLFFTHKPFHFFNYTFCIHSYPNGHHKMFYLTLFAYMLLIATNHKIIIQLKTTWLWWCNFVATLKLKVIKMF